MRISPLIDIKAELTDGGLPAEPIVLSTRIRLARNLCDQPFPGWAEADQRDQVRETCLDAFKSIKGLAKCERLVLEELSALERQVLVERRLISRELAESEQGSAVVVSRNQHLSIMINEEDHLRLQAVRSGFNFRKAWAEIDALDTQLEASLDYAFDENLGYMTACPTNLGTGMRASAMLHLPGLVMQDYMEKVVRMVNQLGMAVRGFLGEGSEAAGSIFQISNQQTLGENEETILNRLINILHAIIEQEQNARNVLLEQHPHKLLDKIGRAYGILQNGHLLSSDEAMHLLGFIRLAVDLDLLPEKFRSSIDRLMMEIQPGHIQYSTRTEIDPQQRDVERARMIREQLDDLPNLSYITLRPETN